MTHGRLRGRGNGKGTGRGVLRHWGVGLLAVPAFVWGPSAAAADGLLTEQDFFAPLPQVLTVTRLAQPPADVPGAVTVIDRDTIRRSGARDVTDLLRLVPGYFVGGFNGANVSAVYHMPLDEFGQRNLVLVDGRSLYGHGYLGGTLRGLMTVVLDDIERIEILRGTNSAAYGANALFGVINIITRHAADVERRRVSVTVGNDGIRDATAGLAWQTDTAHHRLSAHRRGDDGYLPLNGINDDRRIAQLHWRADGVPEQGLEWSWRAGVSDLALGMGYEGNANDAPRTLGYRDLYVQGVARLSLSSQDSLQWSFAWERAHTRDRFAFAPIPPVVIDFGSREDRLALDVQHQRHWNDTWRTVVGVGWSDDSIRSRPLFDTDAPVSVQRWRLFGTAEWAVAPDWLLNAGVYASRNSRLGTSVWPRLMVNHRLNEHHTVRAGISRAERDPTLFDLAANVRYRFPTPPFEIATYVSSGTVGPEQLQVQELGYFGQWPSQRLSLDVRLARERLRDYIEEVSVPGGGDRSDFANRGGFALRSLEYQLRWHPARETQLWLGQAWMDVEWIDADYLRQPPRASLTAGWWQRLPNQWDLAVTLTGQSRMNWRRPGRSSLPGQGRVDVRLARSWHIGTTESELALTVQSLGGAQPAFTPQRILDRRVFLTWRVSQ